jgi:Co/Zn/Cd efflux system component
LGQEKETVDLAEAYIRYLLIGLWPVVMFEVLKRFLQTENKVLFPLVSAVLGVVCNVILAYTLVYHSSLGFYGAPLATSIAQWLMFSSLSVYIWVKRKEITEITQGEYNQCQQVKVEELPLNRAGRSLSSDYVLLDSDRQTQSFVSHAETGEGNSDEESAELMNSDANERRNSVAEDKVIGKTWTGWHWREAFQNWREFAILAFPGAAQTSLEVRTLLYSK